jgi:hypothetical protein
MGFRGLRYLTRHVTFALRMMRAKTPENSAARARPIPELVPVIQTVLPFASI